MKAMARLREATGDALVKSKAREVATGDASAREAPPPMRRRLLSGIRVSDETVRRWRWRGLPV